MIVEGSGQVFIKDTGVYLYTRWEAKELPHKLRLIFAKRVYWENPEYLTRLIFDVVSENAHTEAERQNFTISSHPMALSGRRIVIDCKKREITMTEIGIDEKHRKYRVQWFKGSFEEFSEFKSDFNEVARAKLQEKKPSKEPKNA